MPTPMLKLTPLLERFAERTPLPVLARGVLERCLDAPQLDAWFESIRVNATGTWKCDAPSPAVTPDGGGPAYSGFRIPTGNAFGLIMQRADNTLEHTGASRTVDVSGNEVLRFMMNDVPGAYSDNSGALSVSWSCQ